MVWDKPSLRIKIIEDALASKTIFLKEIKSLRIKIIDVSFKRQNNFFEILTKKLMINSLSFESNI